MDRRHCADVCENPQPATERDAGRSDSLLSAQRPHETCGECCVRPASLGRGRIHPVPFVSSHDREPWQTETSVLGLDAVRGSLDPYRFAHAPTENETVRVETRNSLPASLELDQAQELLVAKVRRLLYGKGFFRLHAIEISAEPLDDELHIPYWLGFSGSGSRARLKVMDGVRRQREGGKVRSIFEAWLTAGPPGAEPLSS